MYSLTGSFHIWLTLTVIKGDNKHMLHFFPSFKTCFSVYLTSMQKNLDRTVIFTLDNWDAFWPDPWVRKMFTLFFRVNGFFMPFGVFMFLEFQAIASHCFFQPISGFIHNNNRYKRNVFFPVNAGSLPILALFQNEVLGWKTKIKSTCRLVI